MIDLNRATGSSAEIDAALEDQYDYHEWTPTQKEAGVHVRKSLVQAARILIQNVPPCPDRSAALRKLREARMDCNSAITHNGKY